MRSSAALALFISVSAAAQWDVPARIQLDGAAPEDRQVTGLEAPASPADGVSAGTVRGQWTTRGIASGGDQIDLVLTPAPAAYAIGMQLSFEPSTVNTGAATLNVNGLGAMPIVKFASAPLDSADLRVGVPVNVVYDGAAFQLVSQLHPSCPTGFRVGGRDVCIEEAWHDSTTFYGASNYCAAHNARLCTFGEWYRACAMPGGILPSVVAFEWVDEAANNTNDAKRVGSNSSLQIGCELGGLSSPLTPTRFRCCYDR